MHHHIHQTYAYQGIGATYQVLHNIGSQQLHQINAGPVNQLHQLYIYPAEQQLSFYEHVNPQNIQIYREQGHQQHSQFYYPGYIQQHDYYRNVHQADQQQQPPLQPETETHVCGICNKTCKLKKELKAHNAGHTRKKSHVCDICHKSFTRKESLRRHKLTHTGEKPHECEVCHRGFAQKIHLQKHNLIHTGQKPHKCNECYKGFAQKSTLQLHILTHTRRIKPYKCEVCNKSFAVKRSLKIHSLTHTDQKQRRDSCEREFALKSKLEYQYSTHTGVKNHTCEICNWGFDQKRHLDKYYLVHPLVCQGLWNMGKQNKSALLKNVCKICKQGFASIFALRAHSREHSANHTSKWRKANENTEEAKQLEDNIIIPIPEPEDVEQEVSKAELDQSQPGAYMKQLVTHAKVVKDNCEITYSGNNYSSKQALNITDEQLDSIENGELFDTIDQPLTLMVPRYLNLGAGGHFIKTVAQRARPHLVPQNLRNIGHSHLHSKNRDVKRKKGNRNTEGSQKQIVIPISEPEVSFIEKDQPRENFKKQMIKRYIADSEEVAEGAVEQ